MHVRASLVEAGRRYKQRDLEYSALRVVGRGLFLAVMLMVGFLYVFTRATDLIAGVNEVLIPTITLAPDADLGALAQGAFTRTSASVVSVLGAVTFMISAALTGHALRTGSYRALLDDPAASRLLSARTALWAIALAGVVFTTWVLTLATTLRRTAWVTLLGRDINTTVIDVGKVVVVGLSLVVVAIAVAAVQRVITGHLTRRGVFASLITAIVMVGANFFLLYTYVGALINPAVSAGVVLILTLLLWVNIVTRTYLAALCWAAPAKRA